MINNDYGFNSPRIEINGNECILDGIKSIIDYKDNEISVSFGKRIVKLYGFDLKIQSYTCDGVIVDGCITSIEFSKEN